MGDYFDLAADLAGLPRPPRISRAQAAEAMSPVQLSFWSESRRLDNRRMKRELRLALHYPTVETGLQEMSAAGPPQGGRRPRATKGPCVAPGAGAQRLGGSISLEACAASSSDRSRSA
jgi:hypothetical protein